MLLKGQELHNHTQNPSATQHTHHYTTHSKHIRHTCSPSRLAHYQSLTHQDRHPTLLWYYFCFTMQHDFTTPRPPVARDTHFRYIPSIKLIHNTQSAAPPILLQSPTHRHNNISSTQVPLHTTKSNPTHLHNTSHTTQHKSTTLLHTTSLTPLCLVLPP